MTQKNPITALACSIIPGLGQVYCGEFLRGLAFLAGVFFGSALFLLGMMGFWEFIFIDPALVFLLLTLIVWVGSGADAYTRSKKMNLGELAPQKTRLSHMILFIILAVLAILLYIALAGVVLLFAAFSYFEGYSAMHDSPNANVTFLVEKNGTAITVTNLGGDAKGVTGYAVMVNGNNPQYPLNATPGSRIVINGTTGSDRILVRGYWNYGASQTFVDKIV